METKKMIVLIVEDSLPVTGRIFCLLENMENIELVLHSANHCETRKILNEMSVDIVLLDINLPDGNGIELLKEMKNLQPATKVIMLTNYATDDYRQTCDKLGADFFLDKSYDFDKIPGAITALQVAS